jgi:hypothetical protein
MVLGIKVCKDFKEVSIVSRHPTKKGGRVASYSGFCIRDTGFWPSGPHHPSGALGGSGHFEESYMLSSCSQHSLEQKLTWSKQQHQPEKLVS